MAWEGQIVLGPRCICMVIFLILGAIILQWRYIVLDSMGVGAVEMGRNYAPDHHRRHQEAPKRIPATPAAFSRFWFGFLRREGGWGSLWLFQVVHCRCRAVKGKIYAGGF
jgi:hypothetical protein